MLWHKPTESLRRHFCSFLSLLSCDSIQAKRKGAKCALVCPVLAFLTNPTRQFDPLCFVSDAVDYYVSVPVVWFVASVWRPVAQLARSVWLHCHYGFAGLCGFIQLYGLHGHYSFSNQFIRHINIFPSLLATKQRMAAMRGVSP